MTLLSATAPRFLETARAAIRASGELLALHRPAYSAGAKDWRFLRAAEDLDRFVATGRRRSSFTVFLRPELPLRGPADDQLLEAARHLLAGHGELLMAELDAAGDIIVDAGTDAEAELAEWLRERHSRPVAVGRYPPFWIEGDAEEITGYGPDPDGVVRPGAY